MQLKRVGKIFNTRGLRGELKVKPTTDFIDERFCKNAILYLEDGTALTINKVQNYKNGNLIVVFKGLEDINLVEKYKGQNLYAEKKSEHLADDEYYISDLIGLKVYSTNDELLGEVEEVLETGANSVLRVAKNRLIPYVDQFIVNIDLEKGTIIVELIEGM